MAAETFALFCRAGAASKLHVSDKGVVLFSGGRFLHSHVTIAACFSQLRPSGEGSVLWLCQAGVAGAGGFLALSHMLCNLV